MRVSRIIIALFISALVVTLTASGTAPTSDYSPESRLTVGNDSAESFRVGKLLAGLLPLVDGDATTEEVPASPFVPPGKPDDRPPDPPGQNDPPNPPGQPDDRPPGHSKGGA